MPEEILAFANFDFKISTIPMKVIVGGRVIEAERFVLNWAQYLDILKKKKLDQDLSSPAFQAKCDTPRSEPDYFLAFKQFQAEIRNILDVICQEKAIPPEVWEIIFKEAGQLSETYVPVPPVEGLVSDEDLQTMVFIKQVRADTYRALLFGQLRDLIVDKTVFNLRKCPECRVYFLDQTKNRCKVYCSSRSCGNRAKQRAFHHRRRTFSKQKNAAQQTIPFTT